MKKILFVVGIAGLLIAASCETPQPATDQPGTDSTVNNNTDTTSMSRPDSTQNK